MRSLLRVIIASALLLSALPLAPRAFSADEPREDPLLKAADDKFDAASEKIEAAHEKALDALRAQRLADYKSALKKALDDKDAPRIAAIQEHLSLFDGPPGSLPKWNAKFRTHTYSLIKEACTWHVAKRRCEQLGGHLVCIETGAENDFVKKLARGTTIWIGATDEEQEGTWKWVNGAEFKYSQARIDNTEQSEHHLAFEPPYNHWNDWYAGKRLMFICEWE